MGLWITEDFYRLCACGNSPESEIASNLLDFYQPLKGGVMPTISLTSFLKILTKGTPQKVQEYKRYLAPGGYAEFFEAPAGSYSSPLGLVTIKLEPEFGAVVNNQHRAIQIWNSSGSNLSRTVAGVGIYLLGRLCQGDFAHCKPGILDLRKRELYLSDALPPNIEPIVTSELAWLDGFVQAHSKAA